jgi:uncharacterized repeat protein (TIGR01451 family)
MKGLMATVMVLCAASAAARALIIDSPDPAHRVRLGGNIRPETRGPGDLGAVAAGLALEHMQLLLKRPAERQASLEHLIQAQHDPASPWFHRWLTPGEVAAGYGLAEADIAAVTDWLSQQGFTVNAVYRNSLVIDFSGTAEQVRRAFHTDIHAFTVAGERHVANISDPEIPAALAPAVHGIVSLHDFRPRALHRAKPDFSPGAPYTLVTPADLATLYNLNPLFAAGISGQGQTIVLIEDSNVYSSGDWTTFRATFDLSGYSGTLSQVQPQPTSGRNNCGNPGVVNAIESEAALDIQWASAAAPGAAIELASCADTITTFGGFIALQNVVARNTAAIVSISYGECEALNGSSANAAFNALYQTAVAQGISVFVAAGDSGADACDQAPGVLAATSGIGVSGYASTPYNVAVGGTDFGDTYLGSTASYWSGTNSATDGSALSYVPEVPWNDSCAGALLAGYSGYGAAYGSGGFCNSAAAASAAFLDIVAGGGGPSALYPKPTWQSGLPGLAADGRRDLPDVSLFAGNGVWYHYYVYCDSDIANGGKACTGAPNNWSGGGGTSYAAPIVAGIQALVNQKAGARQGNPNAGYYAIAAAEYGASGNTGCNSSNGNSAAAGCVFYDVTLGDIALPCTGAINCYLPSGTYGVLSTSDTAIQPAYAATTGWDFATGIGTINAANLVNGWATSDLNLSVTTSASSAGRVSYGWTIANAGPRTATPVTLSATLPAGVVLVSTASSAGCSQAGQAVTCTLASLAVGASAQVTLVVQATGLSALSASFSATAGNGVLFPANAVVTTSVPIPAAAPLPWYSGVVLGSLLAWTGAAARRRRGFTALR